MGVKMKTICCLFLIGILVTGCASTVELKSTDTETFIAEGPAVVHLKSGYEYDGRDAQAGNGFVRLRDKENKSDLQFPVRDINYIEVTNHRVGMGDGVLIGGLSTGTLALILFSSGHSDNDYTGRNVREAFTLIGIGAGGVVGLVIGGITGHHYTYIFPEESNRFRPGVFIDSVWQNIYGKLRLANVTKKRMLDQSPTREQIDSTLAYQDSKGSFLYESQELFDYQKEVTGELMCSYIYRCVMENKWVVVKRTRWPVAN
jgi:hypothetical protein